MLNELVALTEKAQGRPLSVPAHQPAKGTSSGIDTTVSSL